MKLELKEEEIRGLKMENEKLRRQLENASPVEKFMNMTETGYFLDMNDGANAN